MWQLFFMLSKRCRTSTLIGTTLKYSGIPVSEVEAAVRSGFATGAFTEAEIQLLISALDLRWLELGTEKKSNG